MRSTNKQSLPSTVRELIGEGGGDPTSTVESFELYRARTSPRGHEPKPEPDATRDATHRAEGETSTAVEQWRAARERFLWAGGNNAHALEEWRQAQARFRSAVVREQASGVPRLPAEAAAILRSSETII